MILMPTAFVLMLWREWRKKKADLSDVILTMMIWSAIEFVSEVVLISYLVEA